MTEDIQGKLHLHFFILEIWKKISSRNSSLFLLKLYRVQNVMKISIRLLFLSTSQTDRHT